MIPCQRHLFEIPENISYFNCGYMSPQLKSVRQAGHYGVNRKSSPWQLTPTDFFTLPNQARSLFASLVNAPENSIAIVPSASYGLAIASKNIMAGPGRKILVLEDQFPSNIYCWKNLCARTGAEIVTIQKPTDFDWTAAVLDAIDDDTAFAALGNIHWTDGSLLNLVAIGEKLRAHGAKLVLDITQSIGALPFDVGKVQPDFMVAACYKWMLGPYSLGFMYVAPDFHDGEPIEYNWLNREGSEDFSGLVDYRDDYQEGAIRYDMGERANFSLMPMAIAALEQLLEWGVPNIQDTLRQRTNAIAQQCTSFGMDTLPETLRAGHFLGLRHKDGLPRDLLETLLKENIYVSVRGASLRVTPHLFNTDKDADRLVAILSSALERR
jgi:selenocysteine lyase/cysteine desulfurase